MTFHFEYFEWNKSILYAQQFAYRNFNSAKKKTTKTTTTDATNDDIDILNTLPNKLRVFCLKKSVDDDGIHKTQNENENKIEIEKMQKIFMEC